MNLSNYITQGEQKLKTGKALANLLGINPQDLSAAKKSRRGLPAYACVKLAAILGIDPMAVIAASELVTEKNPVKKALFAPFVLNLQKPALWLMGIMTATLIGGMETTDAKTNDTNNMSSPPLQPALLQGMPIQSIGIMSTHTATSRESPGLSRLM